MTDVFNSISEENLRQLLRRIFVQLCDDHKLTEIHVEKREILALALIAASNQTNEEAQMKASGMRAIVNS